MQPDQKMLHCAAVFGLAGKSPTTHQKKTQRKRNGDVIVLKQRPNTQCRAVGRTDYVSLFFPRCVLEYSVVKISANFQFDEFKSSMQLYSSFKFPAFVCSKLHSLFFPDRPKNYSILKAQKWVHFLDPEMGLYSGPENGSHQHCIGERNRNTPR